MMVESHKIYKIAHSKYWESLRVHLSSSNMFSTSEWSEHQRKVEIFLIYWATVGKGLVLSAGKYSVIFSVSPGS